MGTHSKIGDTADLFVEFAQALLVRMRSHESVAGLPEFTDVRVVFLEDGHAYDINKRRRYYLLLQRCWDDGPIWTIEGAERCAERLLAEGILRRPGLTDDSGNPILNPTFDQMRWVLVSELAGLVVSIAETYETLYPPREQIVEAYQRFAEARRRTNDDQGIRTEVTVPLQNFEAGICGIRLGHRFELVRFTPEDKTVLWNLWARGGYPTTDETIRFGSLRDARFRLVGTYTVQPGEPDPHQEFVWETERTIRSLRLLKSGMVGALGVYGQTHQSGWRSLGSRYDCRELARRPSYLLGPADLAGFAKLYDALGVVQESKRRGQLDVAIRRFNQSLLISDHGCSG